MHIKPTPEQVDNWELEAAQYADSQTDEYYECQQAKNEKFAELAAQWGAEQAAREIEQAVIAKLATVSVEPLAYVSSDELGYVEGCGRCGAFYGVMANAERKDDPDFVAVYTGPQLAAARVQENERIANWYYNEGHRLAVFEVAPAIRTLIASKD